MNGYAKDIFALVADKDMEQAFEGLLAQHEELRIRRIRYDIEVHPNHDPGCRKDPVGMLRPYITGYRYALVVFDHHGCGQESLRRQQIQQNVEKDLGRNGWDNRCKVIVIEPELENWVWAPSENVSEILGWGSDFHALKQWLQTRGLWSDSDPKPSDPKRAMQEALRHKRVRRSSTLFKRIADISQPQDCQDPAFVEFRRTLQSWFPADNRIRN